MTDQPSMRDPVNVPLEIANILGVDPDTAISIKLSRKGNALVATVKMHGSIEDDSISYGPLIELFKHYKVVPVEVKPLTP